MGGGYRGSVRALRGWRAPDWKSGALKRVGFVGCGLRPVAYVPDALSGR